jgi:hypothetical protein
MGTRRFTILAAHGGALGVVLLFGFFAFVQERRVPLLGWFDLGIHELGHFVCYPLPVPEIVTAGAGSTLQVAVPLGLGIVFLVRRSFLEAAVCWGWAATSAQDASVYVADAPYERLQLIGGTHDWAFVLGPEHLYRLDRAGAYADIVRRGGSLLLITAVALLGWSLWVRLRPEPPEPEAPTRVRIRTEDWSRATVGADPQDGLDAG